MFPIPLLKQVIQFFSHNRIGYIHAPTGWGKTLLAKYLIKYYLCQRKSILFLVSQNNQLLIQTAYKPNGELLFPNSIVFSSDNKSNITAKELLVKVCSLSSWLIFASLQSLLAKNNILLKLSIVQRVDIVIIDEIHNFIKNKGNEFIQLINPKAKILGLTATPYQGLIGNMKYVEDITPDITKIYEEKLISCISTGNLAKLNYIIVNSNQDIIDVFDFKHGLSELTKQELSANIENFGLVLKRMLIVKIICERILYNFNPTKILIFCAPNRNKNKGNKIVSLQAKLCASIINGEIVKSSTFEFSNYNKHKQLKSAVYLSSELPDKEKNEILQAFKTIGEPPYVVCTVSMLVEGFNFPDLENLILLRPTLSLRLFEQQIGRVLRLGVFKLKEWANIFEIVDETESLYKTFAKQIFRNQIINEQIQLLNPIVRLEKVLSLDKLKLDIDRYIKVKKIEQSNVISVNLKESSCISRLTHIEKLWNIIKQAKYSSLKYERLCLLDAISNLTIYTITVVNKVLELISEIKQARAVINEDKELSWSCRKSKPNILREIEQLLTLNLLDALEKMDLDRGYKSSVLKQLGYNREDDIANYKKECIQKGLGMPIEKVRQTIEDIVYKDSKVGKACLNYYNRWLNFY